MLYLISAGKRALADGKFSDDVVQDLDKARCGVVIGSALGGMKVIKCGCKFPSSLSQPPYVMWSCLAGFW